MSRSTQSIAPKERINITYTPATGDAQSEVELPMKLLVLGDFKGRTDSTPLEERHPIRIDQENFNKVLEKSDVSLNMDVPCTLSSEPDCLLNVQLTFRHMNDFSPDAIAQSVPELKKLLELREALVALKGPLGNIPAFRQTLQSLLSNEESRTRLAQELGAHTSNTASDLS